LGQPHALMVSPTAAKFFAISYPTSRPWASVKARSGAYVVQLYENTSIGLFEKVRLTKTLLGLASMVIASDDANADMEAARLS
jgi:hypothetical protein